MGKQVKRTIFIVLLLVGAFLITLNSYNEFNNDKNVSASQISLHENEEIVINRTLSHNSNKRLIPTGAVLGINDIDEVVFMYEVNINENDDLKLFVETQNVLIGNSSELSRFINFDIKINNENNCYKVKVLLSLNMPANEVEYNSIINQQISFSIVFSTR